MTAIQICALIALIIAAALIYWTAYRFGLTDSCFEEVDEDINHQRTDSAKNIRELETSLQLIQADHQRLAQQYKKLKNSKCLGEEHHETLLAIAEKLRIAAETFSAFKTGKKLERDSLVLREKALAMASRLDPRAQENAA